MARGSPRIPPRGECKRSPTTHSPVTAAPGVAHFAPAVAPLAQTKPARTSSSPQGTLSVPVTTRIAGAGPGSPFGPSGPAGPADSRRPNGSRRPRGSARSNKSRGPSGSRRSRGSGRSTVLAIKLEHSIRGDGTTEASLCRSSPQFDGGWFFWSIRRVTRVELSWFARRARSMLIRAGPAAAPDLLGCPKGCRVPGAGSIFG